jgi:hypothetical protein
MSGVLKYYLGIIQAYVYTSFAGHATRANDTAELMTGQGGAAGYAVRAIATWLVLLRA